MNFAIAPCSWGVEHAENPDYPHWSIVLDQVVAAGYSGIELGPYGFLPTDSQMLSEELTNRSIQVIAGTLYEDLTQPAALKELLEKTKSICSLLSQISKTEAEKFLVLIDNVKPARNTTAGNAKEAVRLSPGAWKQLVHHIKAISEVAEQYGIRPVIHPHAGGYIEFLDETEKLLHDVPHDELGLCLDTGHVYYAGENPIESILRFSSRLDYVHVKDIEKSVYKRALTEKMGFFDACKLGVMCPIGLGCVDYTGIFAALHHIGYKGWVTVEQERDPRLQAGVVEDLGRSLQFLQQL